MPVIGVVIAPTVVELALLISKPETACCCPFLRDDLSVSSKLISDRVAITSRGVSGDVGLVGLDVELLLVSLKRFAKPSLSLKLVIAGA